MTPEGWVQRLLSECAGTITSGGTPKVGRSDYYGGDIPFLKIEDITRSRTLHVHSAKTTITQKALAETSVRLYPTGTVLFTMYGTIGAVGIAARPMAANQAIAAFLDLQDTDSAFLAYLLLHEAPRLASKAGQTTQANVSGMILKHHRVLLPPLPEQRQIAAILTSVDDAIQATQAVIDQTRRVKQGLLQQLLTRGIGHTRFKATPQWTLGRLPGPTEMPVTWELVPICSVARLESGHTPSRRVAKYWDGTVPWISLHDTKSLGKRVLNDTALTTSELGLANSSARLLPKGTVAFSRTASVGHCVIMGREMATSQDFANYVCGERLHNRYLMHLFRWMQPVWRSLASGSTHQTVYMPVFEKLQILLPPVDEQRQIAGVADSLDDATEGAETEVRTLATLKRALLQDLLTGRVRVKVPA